MAERSAGWVDGVDSAEARLITGALVQAQGTGDVLDPLRVRSGLRDSNGQPGLVTLGTNKVTVNPFQAVLADPAKPGDGPYIVTLDAAKDLPLAAAHASLSRIDLVVAEIVNGAFAVNIYTGTNAASPVLPVPSGTPYLALAQISVPPEGTAPTRTDVRRFTAGMSAVLPVSGDADAPPLATAHGSQLLYNFVTHTLLHKPAGATAWTPYRSPRGDGWHSATLQNGWVNYGAGYNAAGYTLMDDGWVRLRGLVKSGAIGSTKAIFTLPTGYRPAGHWLLSASTNNNTYCRVDVTSNGMVAAVSGDPGWVSLDSLTFATYAS